MTREVAADFEQLAEFLREYSLDEYLDRSDFSELLKMQHKKYFALLTWIAEFQNGVELFKLNSPSVTDDIYDRICESVSDLGSALFNWMHGNYKASRIMMRVAIENYIRAVSSIWEPAQKDETSVFQMFVTAKSLPAFSTSKVSPIYASLHQRYKELCRDAHTSTSLNMSNLTCLADLPSFAISKARSTSNIFRSVSTDLILLCCVLFNDFYQQFHFKNKSILTAAVPSSKRILLSVNQNELDP